MPGDLWRMFKKVKVLFREIILTRFLFQPRALSFSTFLCSSSPSTPFSPAPGLIINPSSISSPLSNSAAMGLAGAHVSLPYQLRAGRAVQSRCILHRFLRNRQGHKTPCQPPPFPNNHNPQPPLDTLLHLHTPLQIDLYRLTFTPDPTSELKHMQIVTQRSVTSSGLGETRPVEVRTSLRCLMTRLYLRL